MLLLRQSEDRLLLLTQQALAALGAVLVVV